MKFDSKSLTNSVVFEDIEDELASIKTPKLSKMFMIQLFIYVFIYLFSLIRMTE